VPAWLQPGRTRNGSSSDPHGVRSLDMTRLGGDCASSRPDCVGRGLGCGPGGRLVLQDGAALVVEARLVIRPAAAAVCGRRPFYGRLGLLYGRLNAGILHNGLRRRCGRTTRRISERISLVNDAPFARASFAALQHGARESRARMARCPQTRVMPTDLGRARTLRRPGESRGEAALGKDASRCAGSPSNRRAAVLFRC